MRQVEPFFLTMKETWVDKQTIQGKKPYKQSSISEHKKDGRISMPGAQTLPGLMVS